MGHGSKNLTQSYSSGTNSRSG